MCRKSIGYTQREVAGFLRLKSGSQVSRWERGERLPNLAQALSFSALYRRLVNDLFYELYQEKKETIARAKDALSKEKIKVEKKY